LLNYITGIGWPVKKFGKYWPADVHLLGKDNNWFHSVIWPAILLAAGIEPPKTVYVHGFVNLKGQKMSKSLGNVIDPVYLVKKYGADAYRYFFTRELSPREDSYFSEEGLVERYNTELANELGNLVSRTVAMIVKYKDGKIPSGTVDSKLSKLTEKVYKTASAHIENVDVNRAVEEIWKLVRETNKYIQSNKPWTMKGKKLDTILFNCANAIKNVCILAWPYIPTSVEEIVKRIGLKKVPLHSDLKSVVKGTVKKGSPIFPKLEYNAEKKVFNLDIRKGKIVDIKAVPKSEKLYKLLIDFGTFKKQAVAGLKPYFKTSELKGKSFVFLTNLAPAKLAGIKSECMILAVEDKGKVDLLTSTGKIELEGYVSEPTKTVSLSDFANYKFKVRDGKVLGGGAVLSGVKSKFKKGRVV
jgi:methionyl-tRNA synthetase